MARVSWTYKQLIMGTRRKPIKDSAEQKGQQKQGAVPTRGSQGAELLRVALVGRKKQKADVRRTWASGRGRRRASWAFSFI